MELKKEILGCEVSLYEIVKFLKQARKKLLLIAVLGAIFGLGNYYLNRAYIIDVVMLNKPKVNNERTLDLISWKELQLGLAPLAAKNLLRKNFPKSDVSIYQLMSTETWWDRNVSPAFALSKSEAKEFPSGGKAVETSAITLLKVTLQIAGTSDAISRQNAVLVEDFIRTGGSYLQLVKMLNKYQYELKSSKENIQGKIDYTNELINEKKIYLKGLEDLYKRYPQDVSSINRPMGIQDEKEKFLPLQNQIIATNIDIINLRKRLDYLKDVRSKGLPFKEMFLSRAFTVMENNYDGLSLIEELLAFEQESRKVLGENDNINYIFLSELHDNLVEIKYLFTDGLEFIEYPIAFKPKIIKSLISGIAIALLLALMVSIYKLFFPSFAKRIGIFE